MPTEPNNLYTFNPDVIGGMIANKEWAGCWDYLGDILESLSISANPTALAFSLELQKDMADPARKKYVNDLGALLGELLHYLLMNDSVVLPDKNFQRLIFLHETIHTLFYIYNVENTDKIVQAILQSGKKRLMPGAQKKLLLLLSLDTSLDMISILRKMDIEYRLAALVSLVGYRKIFRERVYSNKVRLYEMRREIERAGSDEKLILNLTPGYFVCSYLNIPQKHALKENINEAYRQYKAGYKQLNQLAALPQNRDRFDLDPALPTVVVMAEIFATSHAMYRCWGARTRDIQNNFNVIFTIPKDKFDPALSAEYKNIFPFENLGELYRLMYEARPDVLFMPSVGMRFFSVLLAADRVAPIQIMGLGHPATSMSPNIDYVVGPGYIYDEKAFPKDMYIADGYPGTYIPLLPKEKFLAPLPPRERRENVIEIAVVGSDVKVSYPFFKLLKEIVAESPYELHVTFIMSVGVDALYIEKFLQENFKNFSYYGWTPYEKYIETIKSVDIVLNPYPFGHTNTIIDILMCGKPCIGMDGVEPASKSEGDVLRSVGLEQEFVAKDEDDYKKKFFEISERIIRGDTEFFDREKIYHRLFSTEEFKDYDYGKVFQWIYDNHDALKAAKASGRRFYNALDDL